MKPRPAAGTSAPVPVPRMMGAFAVGSLLAVVAIPALTGLLAGGEEGPSVATLLLTWAVMVAASGAYLFPMSAVLGFRRDWFRFGLACLAALELILFVLLPLSLSGRNLGAVERIAIGAASAVLALLVFGQIAKAARRYLPPAAWPAQAKAAMAGLAAAAGLIAQVLTSSLLGESPAEGVSGEQGLLTILASAVSGYCLAEALDRSTRQPMVAVEGRGLIAKTIRIGVALLVVLHLAFLVFLSRIF
ncbi:MAG TPA: hypothetical protein VHJ78_11400 [Actinomycetota bacterium]|nr:hypothetical protein [Actinomycetota bacterium]